MLTATQMNLLVMGMVALQNAACQISDKETVATAYNARFHHIQKELVTLEAVGLLVAQYRLTPRMEKTKCYALTPKGEKYLADNKELYLRTHFSVILGERRINELS